MFILTSLMLLALAAGCAFAIPISVQSDLGRHINSKRWEAGPVLDEANFPDPSVILIAKSTDFLSWQIIKNSNGSQRDALPVLPAWVDASSPDTWAPDVVQLDDGSFVMYYAATTADYPNIHCIGAATSDTVLGPYVAQKSPLICPVSLGGAIDASGYDDNGQRYIVYKIDGNAMGHGGPCGNTKAPIVRTPLVLQPVARDGITLQSRATVLLDNNGAADQGVIEAPSLTKSGNTWILYFSSGCFVTHNYTVSYATADSITGPYKRAERPLFETGDYDLDGPGGMSVFGDGKHMVFHGWKGDGGTLYSAVVGTIDGQTAEEEGLGEPQDERRTAWSSLSLTGLLTRLLHKW
ncbi:uncharacterized protein LTR77_008354 [Saxophila tyrrhenica]|uniref:Uncharacterized protein n=1 Tax=Saxophila tyrrhenica TaxID=1690608 RepID=A0AAV9P4T9_9PEZI|nr:hypothetical protein LTR77_008354 [Saxophila tyrrhenica]